MGFLVKNHNMVFQSQFLNLELILGCLQVDPVVWDRDMQYVQAVEGVSSRGPPRKTRRMPSEIEKVRHEAYTPFLR